MPLTKFSAVQPVAWQEEKERMILNKSLYPQVLQTPHLPNQGTKQPEFWGTNFLPDSDAETDNEDLTMAAISAPG